jgi:hypothetical protein
MRLIAEMKYSILIIIFIFCFRAVSAEFVRGIIINSQTKEEIIGASVVIKGKPNKGTQSGLDGSFFVSFNGKFPIDLVVSCIGYKTRELQINEDISNSVVIFLEQSLIELNEVTIIGDNKGRTDIRMV